MIPFVGDLYDQSLHFAYVVFMLPLRQSHQGSLLAIDLGLQHRELLLDLSHRGVV